MTAPQTGLAGWLRTEPRPWPSQPNADYAGAVRFGLWLLGLGMGGFLLWAVLVPLDEGVPAPGVLSVETKRQRIDHLGGGTVERILVREGQQVRQGDELLVLNETQTRTALNASLGQWRTAAAVLARLEAERDDTKAIVFPPVLLEHRGEPEVRAALRAQEDLFRSRRAALGGELGILRESVRGLSEQAANLEQLREGRAKQVTLSGEQLASFRNLSREGFVSRNQLLDMERQQAEIRSKQGEDLANIGAVNSRLAEFRMRDMQRRVEYKREVEALLSDAQKEASTLAERLASLRDAYERLSIRAPVSGTVVDLVAHTVGGVVKPGEAVMSIVPDSDELVVEAQLPPQYIDRVHPGLAADIHFDAYVSLASRPVVSGLVRVVSADVLTDQRTGTSHYTMRVQIPQAKMRDLGNVRLHPGMQCTVMVKTGERSLLAYLLRPLQRRFTGALSES